MKFSQLFSTASLYLTLNSNSASASFLQGKRCDYLDDQCGRGKYCQTETGDCNLKSASIPGHCQQPPDACTQEWVPVCGCDGETYANECEAHANSTSVSRSGECGNDGNRAERCTVGDNSCQVNEYCKADEGMCGGEGRCTAKPAICQYNYAPVCGCDGETYSNECEAESYGVSVDAQGECCDYLNDTCEGSQFCKAAPGDCTLRSAFIPGSCQVPPSFCTLDWNPVCGCDFKTYANECEASASSVSVMSYGECSNVKCTVGDNTCQSNEYCKAAEGTCGGDGFCTEKPMVCPLNYAPVCGCDGWTYGNECEAESIGENVDFQGECDVDSDACVPDNRPRPVRNGHRFRFKLMGEDSLCTDANGNLYEYGQFNNIENSSQCAEACVDEVRSELADAVLGFDFGCNDRQCRCLYPTGTLNSQNRGDFDSYNVNYIGEGHIAGTTAKNNFYAFKLIGAEAEDAFMSIE